MSAPVVAGSAAMVRAGLFSCCATKPKLVLKFKEKRARVVQSWVRAYVSVCAIFVGCVHRRAQRRRGNLKRRSLEEGLVCLVKLWPRWMSASLRDKSSLLAACGTFLGDLLRDTVDIVEA